MAEPRLTAEREAHLRVIAKGRSVPSYHAVVVLLAELDATRAECETRHKKRADFWTRSTAATAIRFPKQTCQSSGKLKRRPAMLSPPSARSRRRAGEWVGRGDMAIISQCGRCGMDFGHSASDARWLCRKCDGTAEREKAEADRWAALSVDEKLNELKRRLDDVADRQTWDGRIG